MSSSGWTVNDVIRGLPTRDLPREGLWNVELPAPPYLQPVNISPVRVGLAVESMQRHMTDEGWQLFAGLQQAGYLLAGHRLSCDRVDVPDILTETNPSTLVLQDKREWDLSGPRDFRDPEAKFGRVWSLAGLHSIFKLTVLKDAHARPDYHRESAAEAGVHGWVIYYHPRIVKALAPYVRERHLVRTYHSLDSAACPAFTQERPKGCLLSGAISSVYPLRRLLAGYVRHLPGTDLLRHPGYHRNGCHTPNFLKLLGQYRVAICTASSYGYALRKIIEATACGCQVITDLAEDEVLPEIDDNLIRVNPAENAIQLLRRVKEIIRDRLAHYDPERQAHYAELARRYYDYRAVGSRLAHDIESLRRSYVSSHPAGGVR